MRVYAHIWNHAHFKWNTYDMKQRNTGYYAFQFYHENYNNFPLEIDRKSVVVSIKRNVLCASPLNFHLCICCVYIVYCTIYSVVQLFAFCHAHFIFHIEIYFHFHLYTYIFSSLHTFLSFHFGISVRIHEAVQFFWYFFFTALSRKRKKKNK